MENQLNTEKIETNFENIEKQETENPQKIEKLSENKEIYPEMNSPQQEKTAFETEGTPEKPEIRSFGESFNEAEVPSSITNNLGKSIESLKTIIDNPAQELDMESNSVYETNIYQVAENILALAGDNQGRIENGIEKAASVLTSTLPQEQKIATKEYLIEVLRQKITEKIQKAGI